MNRYLKRLLISIISSLFIIILFPNIIYAAYNGTISSRSALIKLKNRAVGRTIGFTQSGPNSTKEVLGQFDPEDQMYCLQHEADSSDGLYVVDGYAHIEGNKATGYMLEGRDTVTKCSNSSWIWNDEYKSQKYKDKHGKWHYKYSLEGSDTKRIKNLINNKNRRERLLLKDKTISSKENNDSSNLAMVYLLNAEDYEKYYNDNGIRNMAIHEYYAQHWYPKVGSDIALYEWWASEYDINWSRHGKDFKDKAKKLVENANKYAKNLKDNAYPSISTTIKEVNYTSNYLGPFKVNFNGTIDSIIAKNASGENVSTVISKDKKKKCKASEINSGDRFYIKSNPNISKVVITLKKKKIYTADIWFVQRVDGNAAQRLITVKGGSANITAKPIEIKIKEPTGSLTINKKDLETKKALNAKFKIKRSSDNKWLNGTNGSYSFKDYASEGQIYTTSKGTLKLDKLPYGGYVICEVKAPSGYYLNLQTQYTYVNDEKFNNNKKWERVVWKNSNGGYTATVSESSPNVSINFFNEKKGTLAIYKKDIETKTAIDGAGLKIRTSAGGWLKGTKAPYNYNASYEEATVYRFKTGEYGATDTVEYPYYSSTNGNGIIIRELENGTYYFYEVEAPTGYILRYQDGYDETKGYVDTGKSKTIPTVTKDKNGNPTTTKDVGISIFNGKKVSISGYAWIDKQIGKNLDSDGVFGNEESKIEGITVKLKNKTSDEEYVTQTDSDGKYIFNGVILQSKIDYYYVEFDYTGDVKLDGVQQNISKYIPVKIDTTKGAGSKAIMHSVARENKDLSGIATTYAKTDTTGINTYGIAAIGNFDEQNRIYTNINLGLKKIPDVEYTINQNLAYVKIVMNGYTFTYTYGGVEDTSRIYAPTANWQEKGKISGYTANIYPSDVAYNVDKNTDELKVYVVYRTDIGNPVEWGTTEDSKDKMKEMYVEKKLRIKSLKNTFDTSRYTLEKSYDLDNSNNVTKDFDNWSNSIASEDGKTATTTYDLENLNAGIDPGKNIPTYIEFRVKNEAIVDILNHPYGIIEKYPTKVTATGYHEYTRNDYSWENNTVYKENQDHITPDDTRDAEAPYLIFKLGKDRIISGKVFKDNVETTNGEKLGNGEYDNNENVIKGVKVELIKVEEGVVTDLVNISSEKNQSIEPTDLYKAGTKEGEEARAVVKGKAVTTTNGKGEYSLVGVIPDKYLLRFTYGDGTQKICDLEEKEISTVIAKDYKSTVVKNEKAKESLQGGADLLWYNDLDKNKNFSVALDNLNIRKGVNEEGKTSAIAGTGQVLITLEKTKEDSADIKAIEETNQEPKDTELTDSNGSKETKKLVLLNKDFTDYNIFDGLSFGIIEQPKQSTEIEKLITNIKLKDTDLRVVFNGNPKDAKAETGVAVIDLDGKKDGGSTYVRAEIVKDVLYALNMEIIYQVKVTNTSDINYYNEDYYWYGRKVPNKEVTLTPIKVKDYLDETLHYVEEDSDKDRIEEVAPGVMESITVDGEKIQVKEFNLTGPNKSDKWKTLYTNKVADRDNAHPTSDKVILVAQRNLSTEDNDMEIVSRAKIEEAVHTPDPLDQDDTKTEQIKIAPKDVDKGVMAVARASVSEPTGENRNITTIYVIAGIMALLALSTGIVIIKKKI